MFNSDDDIDGIDIDDFVDDDDEVYYNGDDMFGSGYVNKKCRHLSGIEGVVIAEHDNYYWVAHSGGQESFIHGGELKTGVPDLDKRWETIPFEPPTKEELEAYLGHDKGLEWHKQNSAQITSV